MSEICDDIVVCDDSSTDGSKKIAEKYTKHIITLEDDFEAELIHKQRLLSEALKLKPDFILSLDSDEIIDKPSNLRSLCEDMQKRGIDGAYMHLKNLWKKEDEYRVDSSFNSLFKCNLWKNNGKLEFNQVRGLHQAQTPIGLSKHIYSNIEIIHYGFSSEEEIKKKYNRYKKHGQTGWALERISPFSKAIVRKLDEENYTPKVTVVIPVYNTKPEYLIQCLNSINESTYWDYDILVYDDGSDMDNSINNLNICSVMNAIYISHPDNKGIGYARNKLVEMAIGEYLMFISSDDFLLPHTLKVLMEKPEKDVFYYMDFIIHNETTKQQMNATTPEFEDNEAFVMQVIASAKQSMMFTNYNMFSSTENWKRYPFDAEYKTGEDLEHLLRALLIDKAKFKHIARLMFVYREHEDMSTAKIGMDAIKEKNKKIFKKINGLLGFELF